MRNARGLILILILGMLSVSTVPTGCSIFRRPANAPHVEPIPLKVRNDNFSDMTVAVVIQGITRRLGTVSGNSVATFAITRSMYVTSDINIVATAIGGSGRASSGTISVSEGQEVEFHIAPVLRQSSVVVR
jgi:hypothetical protein